MRRSRQQVGKKGRASQGKTLVSRTQGTKIATEELKGRVLEARRTVELGIGISHCAPPLRIELMSTDGQPTNDGLSCSFRCGLAFYTDTIA